MALRRFPQHAPLFGLLTILVLSGVSGTAFAANQGGRLR
jgi:hypothetical protein